MATLIKRLSKEEIAEGLTLELVNSIRMERTHSPVQLQLGDEPCNLLPCTDGFWVMVEGEALKDAQGKRIVWKYRDCQIGRARYLLHYGAQEKEAKIQALLASWKKEAREHLDKVKRRVDSLAKMLNPNSDIFESNIFNSLAKPGDKAKEQKKFDEMNSAYQVAESMWQQGQFVDLIQGLGIRSFTNPMLSVKFNDKHSMKVLVNTFGKAALDKWDGQDMLYKYAQIEIEKQYPI